MKEDKNYRLLVKRYLSGQISKEELEVFVKLGKEGKLDEHLRASMDEELDKQFVEPDTPLYKHNYFIWAISAALLCLVISITLLQNKATSSSAAPSTVLAEEVLPGSNKAILTLGNGKQITLDSVSDDQLTSISEINSSKTKRGTLVYNEQGSSSTEPIYNTITIPEGGQYHIVLPDGSEVWLNASSSLQYPTFFSKDERRVTLTGEAYFEIAQEVKRPFYVVSVDQQIKVLGTKFNVKAYENEDDIKTSLLEGKVQVVSKMNQVATLAPGQQSKLTRGSRKLQTLPFDMEEAIAWKKGNFLFNETSLVDILSTIARWYAVRVDFSSVPAIHYNGFISRNVTLSKVLTMLEETGNVKFSFKDKTIKVITK